jgi:PEP-CTERM motif
MLIRRRLNLAGLVFLVLCFSASAFADPQSVTLSFATPVLSGNPGDGLDFFWKITVDAGANDFTLNNFNVSLPALGPGAVQIVFSPIPITSAGTESTNDFFVYIPDPFPGGSYGGVLSANGTLGATPFNMTADFTVNVNGPTDTVPEPAMLLMFGSGTVGLLVKLRKKSW